MRYIKAEEILNRVHMGYNMNGVTLEKVVLWITDMVSKNNIGALNTPEFYYTYARNYQAPLKARQEEVLSIYLCPKVKELPNRLFDNNRLFVSLSDAFGNELTNDAVEFFGSYQIIDNILKLDCKEGLIGVKSIRPRVDDQEMPLIPYHGSLLSAAIGYVKMEEYRLLVEADREPANKQYAAELEYIDNMRVYVAEKETPDEAVAISIANATQRLVRDKGQSVNGKHLPEQRNL